MKDRLVRKISWAGFILFFFIYLFWLVKANIDLSGGRFHLFMDEQITFGGITNIYNSTSMASFLFNIFDGNDLRYGRILWNLSALTSFIPYQIWGDSGQIIATRMTQAFFLFAAYFILVWTFIKNYYLRLLGIITLLIMPFTSYYASMPKPEPLQIFFLSLFLRNMHLYGLKKIYHWIYLGLSFGAKISSFPLALFLFISSPFMCFLSKFDLIKSIKTFIKQIAFFICGLIIAVPILGFGIYKKYIDSTFLNTSHGSDDSSINIYSWIKYVLFDYFADPDFIPAILISFIVISIIFTIYYQLKNNKNFFEIFYTSPGLIMISGFSFILPVMIFTKRVWGFYLHNGSVLLIIGSIAVFELFLNKYSKTLEQKNKLILYLFILLAPFIFFQGEQCFKNYIALSKRTESADYKEKYMEYDYLKTYLKQESIKKQKNLKVYIDPSMFLLEDNIYYKTRKFWGPFLNWKDGYDFVIFNKELVKRHINTPETNINYRKILRAHKEFQAHVVQNNSVKRSCSKFPCYREVKSPLDKIKILRKDG